MWKVHKEPNQDFLLNLSKEFAKLEKGDPRQFPSFFGTSVLVASDYSDGRHDSTFYVLSLLITDNDYVDKWDAGRTCVRAAHLADNRRMSYKALSDSRRLQALTPFLDAANHIPGLLVTFGVHKSLLNLFTAKDSLDQLDDVFHFHARWKLKTLHKLTLAAGFVTFCCGGLLQDDHNILWVTDDDDFTSTDKRMRDVTKVLRFFHVANMPGHIGNALFQKVSGLPNPRVGMYFEDMCSISDLVAGAYSDCLSSMAKERELTFSTEPTAFQLENVAEKSKIILGWHEQVNFPLRRLLCVFVPVADPEYAFRVLFPRSAHFAPPTNMSTGG